MSPSSMWEMYEDVLKNADPRVDGYFMMSTPWPSFIICILYVYLVEYGLPKFMENRKPFELRTPMMIYNFAMVILSGYTFLEFGFAGWFTGYSFGCQVVDYSNSPKAVRMVNICWLFYITKFIELLDTVFFVLRKKYNQVTFLHVYHHGIMPVSLWFGVKFVPGGFGTLQSMINSLIHFLMYTYYGLAALGPQYQRFLWWKKYMTTFQMTQFLLVCVHASQLFFIDCDYPKLFAYWIALYAVIFLIMFVDFYVKAYKKKPSAKVTNGTRNALQKTE